MSKLIDIYKRRVAGPADNQFLPILEEQSNDSNFTDPMKQTISQLSPLKRPKRTYEAKSV